MEHCALCEKELPESTPEENQRAEDEAVKLWGVSNASKDASMAAVCDECFEKIHPEKHPDLYADTLEELRGNTTCN